MLSHQQGCGFIHARHVRSGPNIPPDGLFDGEGDTAQAIPILAISGIEPGMECVMNTPDGPHGNRAGQKSAHGGKQPMFIDLLVKMEVGHLTTGMDAGIRTTGARDRNRVTKGRLECRFKRTLNRGVRRLDLPTVPIRSEIFYVQPIGGHCSAAAYLDVGLQQR